MAAMGVFTIWGNMAEAKRALRTCAEKLARLVRGPSGGTRRWGRRRGSARFLRCGGWCPIGFIRLSLVILRDVRRVNLGGALSLGDLRVFLSGGPEAEAGQVRLSGRARLT